MSINHAEISLVTLNPEAYQLKIDFFNVSDGDPQKLLSIKQFDFIAKTHRKKEEIVDIYSINSTVNLTSFTDLKGVCSTRDKTELVRSLNLNPSDYSNKTTLFTLDVKDQTVGYTHDGIAQGEAKVCEYFSGKKDCTTSTSLRKFRNVLHTRKACSDFIYCEGSLKKTILEQLEDKQVCYLNSREGSQKFCQLTEVFMNASKFGHCQRETSPEQFIYSVSPSKNFPSFETSTVRYPKGYKKSVPSVATMFNPIFETTSSVDAKTKITVLKLKEKA